MAGALSPTAPRTHRHIASRLFKYLRSHGLEPVLLYDGTPGASFDLAKADTHEERLAERQRDLRKEWMASVGGAARGPPNGLVMLHAAVYADLTAACATDGVPLLTTKNEADATLAYIGSRRRPCVAGGALPRLYILSSDSDVLLVPGAVVIRDKKLKYAFLAEVLGQEALPLYGVITDGVARRIKEQATALLLRARHELVEPAAVAAAVEAAVALHLTRLAAITNNDFVQPAALGASLGDDDGAAAEDVAAEGPVSRHWRDFMSALPAPVAPLWREAASDCPLVVGAAWFAQRVLRAPGKLEAPLRELQTLLSTDARASYAWRHLSGGLAPLEAEAAALHAAAQAGQPLLQLEGRRLGGSACDATAGAGGAWEHEQLNAGALLGALGVLVAPSERADRAEEAPVRLRAAEAVMRAAAAEVEVDVAELVNGLDRCTLQPVVVGSAEPSLEAVLAAIDSACGGYDVADPALVSRARGIGSSGGRADGGGRYARAAAAAGAGRGRHRCPSSGDAGGARGGVEPRSHSRLRLCCRS